MEDSEQVCGKCGSRFVSTPTQGHASPELGGKDISGLLTEKNLKIGILAASALMILSTVLPCYKVMGYSISLLLTDGSGMGDGVFFVAIAALCIVFLFMKKVLFELVAGTAGLLLALYELSQSGQLAAYGSLVSKGIGFYLMVLSGIALCALCALHFLQDKKSKTAV